MVVTGAGAAAVLVGAGAAAVVVVVVAVVVVLAAGRLARAVCESWRGRAAGGATRRRWRRSLLTDPGGVAGRGAAARAVPAEVR